MRRRIAIVLNPRAGRGSAARQRDTLEHLLNKSGASEVADTLATWEIHETRAPGDAVRLAAECAQVGVEIVAAAGGDGTLSEVLNGLIGTQTTLALLPLGTGNDFARTVGLYGDLHHAVSTLFHGTPKPIDIGERAGRYFLNIAGCGFDAVVADRTNHGPRWLHGTAAYLLAVLKTLFDFKAAEMTLTLDGERIVQRAMLCSVANAVSYGGGMRVAPDARLDDGLFDLCILAEAGKLEFLSAFPRVFRGTHTTHPKVTMRRARHVRIETDRPLPILMDGEVIGCTPAEFLLHPAAVNFLFPPPPTAGVQRD